MKLHVAAPPSDGFDIQHNGCERPDVDTGKSFDMSWTS